MAGRHRRRRAWHGLWSTGRLAVLAVLALGMVGVGGVTTRLTSALAVAEPPVSGRRGVPRPGSYAVRSKSHPGGTESGLRLDHMVRFAKGRNLWIGFHAIPVGARGPIQSLRQLGQPLSHGCVRQAPEDARALWEFAPVDTAVVVLA